MSNIELSCPCCEATLVIDRVTGEVLFHKEKAKPVRGSFEEMVSNLDRQKQDAAKRFEKNIESQKDRGRLLDEKFKEALARAEKDDQPYKNPLDLE